VLGPRVQRVLGVSASEWAIVIVVGAVCLFAVALGVAALWNALFGDAEPMDPEDPRWNQ